MSADALSFEKYPVRRCRYAASLRSLAHFPPRSQCRCLDLILQFLSELGLTAENDGCYDGSWRGGGELLTAFAPATGKPIARVRQATEQDYESAVSNMVAARKAWAEVRLRPRASVCLGRAAAATAVAG
jgi:hypothetical protein